MQQLCSNSNFHEMICTTSVSEAMFCMPTKNFTEFYANLAIISDLLHNCNLIAANLQQFCCSMIFFGKERSPPVPTLFSEPFQWVWYDSIHKCHWKGSFCDLCEFAADLQHFAATWAFFGNGRDQVLFTTQNCTTYQICSNYSTFAQIQ